MPDGGNALGERCMTDADCPGGTCLLSDNICTQACTTDDDCDDGARELVCGVSECATPGGCRTCVPNCGSTDYTCIDGVSTHCSFADATHCLDCGCPVEADHCVRDVGCFPPSPVGESCVLDRDCASRNCSTFAGICRVAVGLPCNLTNCDICLELPGGTTACSAECSTAADCAGTLCLGSAALGYRECRPSACRTAGSCTVTYAPRDAGDACHTDEQCGSGTCFSAQRCVDAECIGEGWCSEPCAGAGDCDAGTSCVVIPCADGQTEGCGNVCLRSCDGFTNCGVFGGACSGLETPERTIAMVCDVRREESRACMDDAECISTNCVDGFCGP